MDLLDIIAEKRFLGQDFLLWLWFKSEERGGTIHVPGAGDVGVVFEKHMLLEVGEGEDLEKLICQGLKAELREARTGLALGKKPEQARFLLAIGDYEWHVSLKGSLFEYRSVSVPKTMTQSEEADDPAAWEARLLDRIGLFERVSRTVDDLFRLFLEQRLAPGWAEELTRIQKWIKG